MEEKERYKLESYNEAFCQIHDTESGEWYLRKDLVTDLLNQQDKRIKELEEQTYPAYKREHKRRAYLENIEVPRLKKENLQLKKQLNSQPAEIVEKIRKQIFNHFNVNNMEEYESLSLLDSLFTADAVTDMLDDILKEYQKNKEEK